MNGILKSKHDGKSGERRGEGIDEAKSPGDVDSYGPRSSYFHERHGVGKIWLNFKFEIQRLPKPSLSRLHFHEDPLLP